jgi:hypothetical protein
VVAIVLQDELLPGQGEEILGCFRSTGGNDGSWVRWLLLRTYMRKMMMRKMMMMMMIMMMMMTMMTMTYIVNSEAICITVFAEIVYGGKNPHESEEPLKKKT